METGAIYMTGNGRMAAAYRAGDMMQVFGPPYSSPSVFGSRFTLPRAVESGVPQHLPRAGIWKVELQTENGRIATITDFALPDEPCLVRRLETEKPVCMRLYPLAEDGTIFHREIEDGRGFHYDRVEQRGDATCILLKTKTGNAVYNDYPLPFSQFFTVLVRGDARVEYPAPFTYDIYVDGAADLLIVGGPTYPECDQAVQRLQDISYADLVEQTVRWWRELFQTVTAFERVPADILHRERLITSIEDTVINLVVQQSAEGGILAGHAFHLGYVRDQFGVCMALLKLGMFERAKGILQFYVDVFRHSGKILNAQAMGVPGMFHYAENDRTEITGYLLLQFFRYEQQTGDTGFLLEHVDFLRWLYEQQESQLHNGMLPFNGDETYIAGGLIPRDVLNDGSAEATMLFLLSGWELLTLLTAHDLADQTERLAMARTLDDVQVGYTQHFVVDGQYTLNDPARTQGLILPEYRHGVCMNLGKGGCEFFGWTQLAEGDVYLCPRCRRTEELPTKRTGRYQVPSALLMPAYLDSRLLDSSLVIRYLQRLVQKLQTEGAVYSNEAKKKNVGYDYGLLLYNLVRYGLPGQELVYEKLLSQIDEVGAWAEYYVEDRPFGTRYRAWESGINIDALLTYAISR